MTVEPGTRCIDKGITPATGAWDYYCTDGSIGETVMCLGGSRKPQENLQPATA